MALERVPADIRKDGGVARMSDPKMIKVPASRYRVAVYLPSRCAVSRTIKAERLLPPQAIKAAVTIPVMAKCRIGHFVECQIFEEIGADYIDESEVSHTHAR